MLDDDDVSVCGSRAAGRRGQAALAKLPTTDDFTNRKLTLHDRKLILFLLVTLVDRYDRLTDTYDRLVLAYGGREGHWAFGKEVADLQKGCASFLGRGARRAPRWPEIVDLFAAGVSDRNRARILAFAAGLHCRAAGVERPAGYAGPIAYPIWVDSPRVYATQIRAELIELTTNGSDVLDLPIPRGASDPADLAAEVVALKAELLDRDRRLRTAMESLRHKAAELSNLGHRVRALTGELNILRCSETVLRNEVHVLRRQTARLLTDVPTVRIRPVALPAPPG